MPPDSSCARLPSNSIVEQKIVSWNQNSSLFVSLWIFSKILNTNLLCGPQASLHIWRHFRVNPKFEEKLPRDDPPASLLLHSQFCCSTKLNFCFWKRRFLHAAKKFCSGDSNWEKKFSDCFLEKKFRSKSATTLKTLRSIDTSYSHFSVVIRSIKTV